MIYLSNTTLSIVKFLTSMFSWEYVKINKTIKRLFNQYFFCLNITQYIGNKERKRREDE